MAFFGCFDRSVTTGSISIVSIATVIGAPAGIVRASFSLAFSFLTGIMGKTGKNNKK